MRFRSSNNPATKYKLIITALKSYPKNTTAVGIPSTMPPLVLSDAVEDMAKANKQSLEQGMADIEKKWDEHNFTLCPSFSALMFLLSSKKRSGCPCQNQAGREESRDLSVPMENMPKIHTGSCREVNPVISATGAHKEIELKARKRWCRSTHR